MTEHTPVLPPPHKRDRTVMVSAPPFDSDPDAWQPFRFKNLERVSKTQVLLTQKLEAWLPPGVAPEVLLDKTVARLTELFEERVTLKLEHLQVQKPKGLRQLIALPTFATIVTPGPDKRRGLMEVELGLAHAAIDLLLGGAGEPATLRPLSEIEEGVMTFVILSALKAVVPAVGAAFPAPKMERIARSLDELLGIWGDESHVVVLQLRGTLGSTQGWVRLFLPSSWLEGGGKDDAAVRAQRRAENIDSHLSRLEAVTAWLRAEIGRAEISAADLAGLRTGDVVLMDDISARPDLGEGGQGQLRVGMGRCGRMVSELFLEEDRFHARIQGFELGPEPRYERHPGPSAEVAAEALLSQGTLGAAEDYTSPEDRGGQKEKVLDEGANSAEAGELLNDIPLQIAVELSRVAVTADDVLGLKVGQVIDLNRAPGEPVELSVNGKLIGRGELVEIEGHLGVRVTSLTG